MKKTSAEQVRKELAILRKKWGWTPGAIAKLLKPTGGRGKGGNFERDICRLLSEWWSEGDRDDLFWRSSQSGGRATQRKKSGKETFGQYGDITATHPDGYSLLEVFTMELKRGYSSESFINMIDKSKDAGYQMWEGFYHQVTEDASSAKSLSWMLIWQRDRREALVYIPAVIIKQIAEVRWDKKNPYLKPSKIKKIPHIRAKVELKEGKKINVFVCQLSDFLRAVKPGHIKAINNDAG